MSEISSSDLVLKSDKVLIPCFFKALIVLVGRGKSSTEELSDFNSAVEVCWKRVSIF
jgi:hypothetical protein